MDITQLRTKIDHIDRTIIEALAKRLALCPAIAEYKQEKHVPIEDPEREGKLLSSRTAWARDLGISSAVIEDIYASILEESKTRQEEFLHLSNR